MTIHVPMEFVALFATSFVGGMLGTVFYRWIEGVTRWPGGRKK